MDADWCDNTPATPAERCVSHALGLLILGDEDDFITWAEHSVDVRRYILEADPRMHFESWTAAVVRAQYL